MTSSIYDINVMGIAGSLDLHLTYDNLLILMAEDLLVYAQHWILSKVMTQKQQNCKLGAFESVAGSSSHRNPGTCAYSKSRLRYWESILFTSYY